MSNSPRLAALALFSAILASSACDRPGDPTNSAGATEAPATDPWTLTTLESLGERAALVAVVRQDAWPAVSARLAPLAPRLGAQTPSRTDLLLAGQLPVFLHMLFGPATSAAPPLTGLDPARPLVLALDEPALRAPPGLLAAELSQHPGSLPGLRHEFVLPAVDPAGLGDALARWFDALGRQEPALAAATPGARAWVLGSGDLVAVVSAADAVRVVGLQRARVPAGTPIESVAPALRGELLRASPPAAARTTGLALAAASGQPLAVLLRPRVLPALLQWQRARAAADALAPATHVEGAQLRRASLAALLRCERALGDGAVDLDDWLLTAADDPHGLRLRVTAGLTPAGAQALGDPSAREPLALRGPAVASAAVRLTLVDRPDPSDGRSLRLDAAEALAACGDVLPYMLLGTPVSALRGPRINIPATLTAQVAITALAGDDLRGAVALDLPATIAIAPLQAFARQFVTGLGREFVLHDELAGERQRVSFGIGVDPTTVFADTTEPVGLAAARVDLSVLAPALRPFAPDLVAPLQAYRRAALDLAREGSLLRGELVFDDGEPLAAGPQLDPAPLVGPARAPAAPSPGLDCARSFIAQAIDALDRARPPAAALMGEALARSLAATEPALRCVEADPATAAHAPALRRMLPLALADLLADAFRPSEAARVLAGPCEAGDAFACRRRAELAQLPDVALPGLHSNCPTHHARHAHRLALVGDRLALDDRPVADYAALTQQLAALAEERDPSLELAIDSATTFAALRPLLAALSLRRDLRLGIVAGHDRGMTTTYQIPMAAPQIAASPPASSQLAPMPAHLRVGAFVLTGDGTALRMRTGTTALGSYPYLHATTIEADARERPDNHLPPMVVATEETPWSTVAVALAGTCDPHALAEDVDVQALLGPPDRSVSILWDPHGPKPLSVKPKARGPNNINSGLFSAKPRVEYCYARALADAPALAGKVVVEFAVSAAGELGAVSIASSTLRHPEVERCIVDAIERHTSWSSADADAVIRWRFDFTRR
ncbi:AgmX/PglI C-terminal domain-containing protein [Nannocystis sp. ILAH1]|uniref:AgmX/PglI C-terminal domain-containing protein n=1 Tax=Nannocystis sp. ILAH1 TaxID=2996789 RepID=UPI0022717132|nr:AgmX/PglI C-terminal domain-containing protein [Nannocystis sp. ILAH1]MCY0989949.1 AgmX/PglI C-terminal domain-containing protein [Nannocystis sp. ILAH1]